MNYNISGIDMMILEVFAMFDTAKVEIKKEHQLLMVSKTRHLNVLPAINGALVFEIHSHFLHVT